MRANAKTSSIRLILDKETFGYDSGPDDGRGSAGLAVKKKRQC